MIEKETIQNLWMWRSKLVAASPTVVTLGYFAELAAVAWKKENIASDLHVFESLLVIVMIEKETIQNLWMWRSKLVAASPTVVTLGYFAELAAVAWKKENIASDLHVFESRTLTLTQQNFELTQDSHDWKFLCLH
ncbi:hypothetical protein WICPIJ_001803 [Wickerhamomyces pijperi]|uniref:Uncharacterized protein n=1 Tax=Wickerhamomyces pijperi TaxID=599730 RepID=A0A9P8QAX1_WICPI|nr:hypothetical protein WICPIJ_001803 [Wickerhamomyces pijperi]